MPNTSTQMRAGPTSSHGVNHLWDRSVPRLDAGAAVMASGLDPVVVGVGDDLVERLGRTDLTLEGILQAQQRFTNDTSKAIAGFDALHVSGVDIFADDYCPASHVLFLNTKHLGFAIHANGYFVREKWSKIPDSAGDRTMKILWDGNLICDNRKAHQGYSNVS